MKKLFFLIAVFYGQTSFANTYLINFTGTGESTTVNSVKVEKLTTGTSLTLNRGDIQRLSFITEIISIDQILSAQLKIYPNPMIDHTILEIFPPKAGEATVSVLDMTGKPLSEISGHLENSKQSRH